MAAADQDARQRLDCHPRPGQDMAEQELTAAEQIRAVDAWWPAGAGSSGRWPILTESMTDAAGSGWSRWRTTEGSRSSTSKELRAKPAHDQEGAATKACPPLWTIPRRHRPRRATWSKMSTSCAWFARAGSWGTTTSVTRDSPSIQGDVPGPNPARAPLARRLPGRGSLVGGNRRGSTLPAQGPLRRGAAVPVSEACLVHVRSTCHRSRAVRSGL